MKTARFWMFSWGIERDQQHEMVWKLCYKLFVKTTKSIKFCKSISINILDAKKLTITRKNQKSKIDHMNKKWWIFNTHNFTKFLLKLIQRFLTNLFSTLVSNQLTSVVINLSLQLVSQLKNTFSLIADVN